MEVRQGLEAEWVVSGGVDLGLHEYKARVEGWSDKIEALVGVSVWAGSVEGYVVAVQTPQTSPSFASGLWDLSRPDRAADVWYMALDGLKCPDSMF